MKVIIEFDPVEERIDMETALNGWKWKNVVWEMDVYLKGCIKSGVDVSADDIRDRIHGIMSMDNLNFE